MHSLPQRSFNDYTAVCGVFSFSSSDGTGYSFSDLQLAHLPQHVTSQGLSSVSSSTRLIVRLQQPFDET